MDVIVTRGALIVDGLSVAEFNGRYPDVERMVEGYDPSDEIKELEALAEVRMNTIERVVGELEDVRDRVAFIETSLDELVDQDPAKVQLEKIVEELKQLREFLTARVEAEGAE